MKEGLNSERFEALLARFDRDRNRAAEDYELLRRKLVKFFEHHQCVRTEDLADETIDRIAKRLEVEDIRDIRLFAYGVAHRVCLEVRRKTSRFISIDANADTGSFPEGEADVEGKIMEGLLNARCSLCLEKCLDKLPHEKRDLILQYYSGEKQARIRNRQELAKKHSVSIEKLRNEVNSIRDKLKSCAYRCLKQMAGRTYQA